MFQEISISNGKFKITLNILSWTHLNLLTMLNKVKQIKSAEKG